MKEKTVNYNYGYTYAKQPKSLESKPKEITTKPYHNQMGRDDDTVYFTPARRRK